MRKETVMLPRAETSEKAIERHLAAAVREAGGIALKFASATRTGYPDRICLLPQSRVFFAELKSRGKKPSKLQSLRIAELRSMGFAVHVLDTRSAVDEMMIEKATTV